MRLLIIFFDKLFRKTLIWFRDVHSYWGCYFLMIPVYKTGGIGKVKFDKKELREFKRRWKPVNCKTNYN